MQNYKVTYSTGKNEHVIELEADDKDQARQKAEAMGIKIIEQIIHIPEPYKLF